MSEEVVLQNQEQNIENFINLNGHSEEVQVLSQGSNEKDSVEEKSGTNDQFNQCTCTILKKQKKINNDAQKKKKKYRVRQDMNLFIDKRRIDGGIICKYEYINKFNFIKTINMPKKFFLAGDILVELSEQGNNGEDDYFTGSKFIKNIHKQTDGSIIVNISNTQAQHNYSQAINILQSTQNYDDFTLSLKLKDLQQPILMFKGLIERVTQFYDPNSLSKIIYHRKKYIEQLQMQKTKEFLKDDDFGQSISFTIDWNLKSMGNQQYIITNPMIALLGANTDDFISFIFRKNLIWLIPPQCRRRILEESVKFLSSSEKTSYSYIFPQLEIKMIDDIMITCECEIFINAVQFPPELCLQGQEIDILNKSDCITVIKFNITDYHLERIIGIRNQHIQDIASKKQKNYTDRDEFILKNFEYYLQSQVFLEKFYSNEENIHVNNRPNLRCHYRLI